MLNIRNEKWNDELYSLFYGYDEAIVSIVNTCQYKTKQYFKVNINLFENEFMLSFVGKHLNIV